jgi:hypothetical protein
MECHFFNYGVILYLSRFFEVLYGIKILLNNWDFIIIIVLFKFQGVHIKLAFFRKRTWICLNFGFFSRHFCFLQKLTQTYKIIKLNHNVSNQVFNQFEKNWVLELRILFPWRCDMFERNAAKETIYDINQFYRVS